MVRYFFLVFFMIFTFSCQKKPSTGLCKNNADCEKGVCFNGKCEECIEDSDCSDLKQCVKNRCTKACETNLDCGANAHCEDGFCIENCKDNNSCPGGHNCIMGKCVMEGAENFYNTPSCQGLEKVNFEFDKFDILSIYYPNLNKLAKCLDENPSSSVIIEGHADERGTPTYNMALSERRANAVKDYLVKGKGIALVRVKTVPYGSQRPLVDEQNEAAYAQNRRAEFTLR